jgi:glycosyltransferase involved in cell wall biosynthesis
MKVLHVTPNYYPATYWGGPVFTTHALCNALAIRHDVELRVLTTDAAGLKMAQRLKADGFPVRFPAGYDVYFTRRILAQAIAPGLLARLWPMVGWADVVHLTATYSFPTIPTLAVCRLRDKPVLWSPRGALQASYEWSEARRKSLKHYWESVCRLVKPSRCVLHVTAEIEKATSLARLPGFEAAVISNGVDVPDTLPEREWTPENVLRLMFISRLDKKKGLENLLRALPRIKCVATLDVYGTGETQYVRSLKNLAAGLDICNRVRFHGHVDGTAKLAAFTNADLFVLPTYSENFGLAIAEALAHGVPAVVGHGAPWEGLESHRCGRWVNNTPETLAETIEEMRNQELAAMGQRGRQWMRDEFQWDHLAEKMRALLNELRFSKNAR